MNEDIKDIIDRILKVAGYLFDKEPSEQALLTEYQTCQQEADNTGSYTFQSGLLYFVTALTLAGAVIGISMNVSISLHRLLLVFILGVFSIGLLYAWKKYTKRLQFIRDVNFERMVTIEKKLKMSKELQIRFLDEATSKDWRNQKWLPLEEEDRKFLWNK